MKSRVIVWTIVGLAVIAGLVFIFATPNRTRTPKLTLERLQTEAARLEPAVERTGRRVAEARKNAKSGEAEAQLGQIDRQLAEARQLLADVRSAGDVKTAEEKLRAARQLMRSLRRETETALRTGNRVPTL